MCVYYTKGFIYNFSNRRLMNGSFQEGTLPWNVDLPHINNVVSFDSVLMGISFGFLSVYKNQWNK